MGIALQSQDALPAAKPEERPERTRAEIARDRKLAKRAKRDAIAAVAVFVVAVMVISFPFIMRAISSQRQRAMIAKSQATVADWPYPQAEEHIKAARRYNAELFRKGQSHIGEIVDPFQNESAQTNTANLGEDAGQSDDSASAKDKEYQSLLNTGGGVMGTIRIPKISVELPIMHGTSQEALYQGAGHLYGTSLPVGGKNTHSVITGHRGMVTALMFTRLDEMTIGDTFTIEVMGKTFAYKVDSIKTILPTEGDKYLKIHKGEDRVTLMTCTPYGINTHRLLVSGVRIPLSELANQHDNVYRDTIVAIAAIAVIIIAALTRRKGWLPIRHATDRKNL